MSENKKELWIEAVRKDGLTWQNVSDLKGDKNKATLIYGISYHPTNFLINKAGKIVAKDLKGGKFENQTLRNPKIIQS